MFPSCYQISEPITYAPTQAGIVTLHTPWGPLEKQVYLEIST